MIKNENTYVPQLEAKNIMHNMLKINKDGDEQGYYDISKIPFNKLYTGSMPYSMEIQELDIKFPDSIKTNEYINGKGKKKVKQYTNVIVDVRFKEDYYSTIDVKRYVIKNGGYKMTEQTTSFDKVIASKHKLRKTLYKEGFKLVLEEGGEPVTYVGFARSSSKARQGNALFIRKDFYEYMDNWKSMGLDYKGKKNNNDNAGLRAYESLTLSGLESEIIIDPKSILLVEDIETKYPSFASITEINEDGDLEVTNKYIENSSNVFDGLSLVDEGVFPVDDNGNQPGMILLRNRFFKSAAFNVKMQEYFKDNGNPEYLYDMFGNKFKTSEVKMITTPSSLKLLKYAKCYDTIDG